MIKTQPPRLLVAVNNLREFFREELHTAIAHQNLAVEDHTEQYVVNLLTMFSRSEALYDNASSETSSGARLKPLVMLLSEALEAPTTTERNRGLQRLGDVSLFMAGFFARSFARKLIDIDYHIAMGGRAYGSLASYLSRGREQALGVVFGELAQKFQGIVDALNEVSELGATHSDRDVLRLYEIWLKTGSQRAGTLLRKLGVEPAPVVITQQ